MTINLSHFQMQSDVNRFTIVANYNRRGLIQGPEEEESEFFQRCSSLPSLKQSHCFSLAKKLFDIEPDWIETKYDNTNLRLWEGGCTWIDGPHITVQLRKEFLKKRSYLGYHEEEILAHELVHAVRGAFHEPIFEEILAYQSSPSRFRCFLGPLLRSSKEAFILIAHSLACLLAVLFEFFQAALILSFFILASFGILRLLRFQTIFLRTKKSLGTILKKESILPVMLRLTDKEIIRFSKMKGEEILAYANKMKKNHLRWQQIHLCYF